MKKIIKLFLILGIFVLSITFKDEISKFVVNNIFKVERKSDIIENNKYASNNSYAFVKITNNFAPQSKEDILNIYYTIINSGMTDFTFYCSKEYQDCINDVDYISNNQVLLSNINNFVPIYNSFSNIETEFDNLGKITIHITHSYQTDDINTLNVKVEEIIKELNLNELNIEDKIKVIHDYIINNTKYDVGRSDNKITTYHSDTAYGALIEHYAICGGYADSMKLFLDYLNIPNYKISSENHIWNLVYVNNKWYHLDLTWDDPVTSNGDDVLEYDYFLITTDELKNIETDQHTIDTSIYIEAKSN